MPTLAEIENPAAWLARTGYSGELGLAQRSSA